MKPEPKNMSNEITKYDYSADKGAGWQGTTERDFVVPFIQLLQAQSKPCLKGSPQFVEGASQGKFLNNASGHVYDEVFLIPCSTSLRYIEYTPKKENKLGEFVATHEASSPIVAAALEKAGGNPRNLTTAAGNELRETRSILALQVSKEGEILGPIVLSCSSMKIAQYKKGLSKIRMEPGMANVPLFAHLLKLSSVLEERKGNSYYNIRLTPARGSVKASLVDPASEVYTAARALSQDFAAGAVKVDHSRETREEAEPKEDGDGVF